MPLYLQFVILLATWTPTNTTAFGSPPVITQLYSLQFKVSFYRFLINPGQLKAFLGNLLEQFCFLKLHYLGLQSDPYTLFPSPHST